MKARTLAALVAAVSAVFATEADADLIPNALTGVTGIPFQQGDNANPGDGSISRVFDGNGLTVGNVNDPTTWRHSNAWQAGWQGNDGEAPVDGTLIADLGSTRTSLDKMYIWNANESGQTDRGANNVDIYYSTTPTIAPAAGTKFDFTSGGWTLLQNVNVPIASGSNTEPVSLVVDLTSIPQARYIGFDMNTNHGETSPLRVGFAEIQFTTVVPEPGALALLGMTAGGLLLRRRRVGRG